MKNILLLYLFLLSAASLAAQQKEYVFKNFTQEEGLPSNEAYYVFEDSKHYIWIATDLGVVRFDGNKFQQFSLPDNVVFKIKEDSKGRIWFFSHKGLLAYFENEKLYPYKYNSAIANRIGRIQVIDAFVDDKDNIQLNSALDSNFHITSDGIIEPENYNYLECEKAYMVIDVKNRNNLVTKIQKRSICETDSITIRLNKSNNPIVYNIPIVYRPFTHFASISAEGEDIYSFTGKFIFKLNANGSYTVKQMPGHILCISFINQNLYVGMLKKGMAVLNKDLSGSTDKLILKSKSVSCIKQDYEGGLWLSTIENGVFYAKNTNIYKLSDDGNEAKFISRLLNVKDSILLYSTENGLHRISKDTSDIFLKIKNSGTNGLFADSRRVLYYSGAFEEFNTIKLVRDPYFKFVDIMNIPSQPVLLHKDTMITSRPSSVVIFKSSFLSSNMKTTFDTAYFLKWKIILSKPAKLFLDSDETIWAATNDGIYKSKSTYDSMIKFMPSNGLLQQGVSNIRQMQNGVFSIGIRFSGIVLIKDTTVLTHITESEGLLSNKIRYILPIKNCLWVATAKGISVIKFSSFNPVSYSITNISKDDGFYNVTINQLAIFKSNIVAATSNGLYFIENPDLFLTRKFPPIPFYIKSVSYFNGDTTNISSISLPYSKKRLVIKYTAISFNSYETVQYQYRFDHIDTSWQHTSNTELLLENLEPGEYHLQIKAYVPNQNRYSAIQNFTITIEKPWWQNNWVRLFCILVMLFGIYLFISKRIQKIQAEEKRKTDLNAKLAELEQTALRSQMNPHFIFNCLTSIQQLIISGNKIDANEYLVKFSRLIRKTLDLSAQPFISIREEKEYLGEYLFLEQLRLSGHFDYTIIADNEIDTNNTLIPNMMIQPVVENCIRHGIKPLENKKGIITIRFERNENAITCMVTDNGVGRKKTALKNEYAFTKHKSYGMDIVRKRLEIFSEFENGESVIEIKDLHDTDGLPAGTEVVLQLPYKKNV